MRPPREGRGLDSVGRDSPLGEMEEQNEGGNVVWNCWVRKTNEDTPESPPIERGHEEREGESMFWEFQGQFRKSGLSPPCGESIWRIDINGKGAYQLGRGMW